MHIHRSYQGLHRSAEALIHGHPRSGPETEYATLRHATGLRATVSLSLFRAHQHGLTSVEHARVCKQGLEPERHPCVLCLAQPDATQRNAKEPEAISAFAVSSSSARTHIRGACLDMRTGIETQRAARGYFQSTAAQQETLPYGICFAVSDSSGRIHILRQRSGLLAGTRAHGQPVYSGLERRILMRTTHYSIKNSVSSFRTHQAGHTSCDSERV